MADPPTIYHQAAYESPTRGDPDDLLLIAGYGFAADDLVVYRIVMDTGPPLVAPTKLPTRSTAESGLAPIVSTADIPYSLTVRLPQIMTVGQTYALWVRTANQEWSEAIMINDARPFWISPAFVYASESPASLPREIKVVGRNLQSSSGVSTRIRLIGPSEFSDAAITDDSTSEVMNHYVARLKLPPILSPGRYRVLLSRDGRSWTELRGQLLEVLPDQPPGRQFAVGDPQFGGCRPDDDVDDTPCVLSAITAAKRAGGGTVYFGPGRWDLVDSGQRGLVPGEGIVVADGVSLQGAGIGRTVIQRHKQWNENAATAAFTLVQNTVVSGFTFRDLQTYRAGDKARAFLQLGEDYQRVAAAPNSTAGAAVVKDVVITKDVFDKTFVAIGSGGLPINRLFITYNTFGAYLSALELEGDQYNMTYKYALEDTVIDYNEFKPGSNLDLNVKSGSIATEIGAGGRVDFSANTADGTSTEYLYGSGDAKGWRAAFFWNLNNNVEQTLVSQNRATCTGDKIGDGESFAFDNNGNTFGFTAIATVAEASAETVSVSVPLAARQNNRGVPVASYYVGHWVQVASGPGLGEARKIVAYSTDPYSRLTTFRVAPSWDVVPVRGKTRIAVGREFWQLYVVDNQVDNRKPLCQKSNRSRPDAGVIGMWAQSADSSIAGNRQYDSDGILIQQNYIPAEHACPDCTMQSFFNSFLDVRANFVEGQYSRTTDCGASGIAVGVASAAWGDEVPPTVGFGVSVSHNVVRNVDGWHGGAISQLDTWSAGPEPHRWPLSDNLIVHHNSIVDAEGMSAAVCGFKRPRTGIAFPSPAIAWRTVLYANSCKNVPLGVGGGGVETKSVCPSSVPNSCECTPARR